MRRRRLEIRIDGQPQVVPWDRILHRQDVDLALERIHLDVLLPLDASQDQVLSTLDAREAYFVVGLIVGVWNLEIVRERLAGNVPHVPEGMR